MKAIDISELEKGLEQFSPSMDLFHSSPLTALGELKYPPSNDPSILLKERFFKRGQGLLLVGPTGVGKSVLAMQFIISWSLGKPCFDIEPVRPLRILLLQAENDEGDLAEMRDSIFRNMKLEKDEIENASSNIITSTFTGAGQNLSQYLSEALEKAKPDILVIDPALSYVGGKSNDQSDVSAFVRGILAPLAQKQNCGVFLIHHTNKQKAGQLDISAYAGTGSAEWANWPRSILTLSGNFKDGFTLSAVKRGQRLGWVGEDGITRAFEKYLKHAEGGELFWLPSKEAPKAGNRSKFNMAEFIDLLDKPLRTTEWQRKASSMGMGSSTFFNYQRRAEREELVESKGGFWSKIGLPF